MTTTVKTRTIAHATTRPTALLPPQQSSATTLKPTFFLPRSHPATPTPTPAHQPPV